MIDNPAHIKLRCKNGTVDMDITSCLIHDDRPDICRNFPVSAANIKYFDKCTHKFDEDNVRSGECCACGQCCVRMPWPKLTDVNTANPEIAIVKDEITGSIIRDPVCRFLVM